MLSGTVLPQTDKDQLYQRKQVQLDQLEVDVPVRRRGSRVKAKQVKVGECKGGGRAEAEQKAIFKAKKFKKMFCADHTNPVQGGAGMAKLKMQNLYLDSRITLCCCHVAAVFCDSTLSALQRKQAQSQAVEL